MGQLIQILIIALLAQQQQAGKIGVTTDIRANENPKTTVTVTAGMITCTLASQDLSTVQIECSASGVGFRQEVAPAFSLSPNRGSVVAAANTVTWQVSQPIVGVLAYLVTANGVARGGQFGTP